MKQFIILQEAAKVIAKAQEASTSSRSQLAAIMSELAASKRYKSRVDMVTALLKQGVEYQVAVADAKALVPSPNSKSESKGSGMHAGVSVDRPAEIRAVTSPLKMVPTSISAECPPPTTARRGNSPKVSSRVSVAPSSKSSEEKAPVDYKSKILAKINPAVLLTLSGHVLDALKGLITYCETIPAVGEKVNIIADEFDCVSDDNTVLAALGRIKKFFE